MATATQKTEKTEVEADHVETVDLSTLKTEDDSDSGEKRITRVETRMTKAKWLACIALCISYTTAFQQNAVTAAIAKHIDDELGPTTYYNWILSAYTISVSVAYPLSGGLSDIFGRRYFFLVGTVISFVGTIIACAAHTTSTVIVAMIFKGLGAGSQQLALAAIAELVTNKQRGLVQAILDLVTLPWSVFGGLVGNAMVLTHTLGFRINFILGVCLNVTTFIAIWFWYYPPQAPYVGQMTTFQRLLGLDWIGVFLMASGIVLTLMGLSFGGTQFPWGAGGTIAPIVIGVTCFISLGLWEWKGAKAPFFAHELFIGKTRTFTLMLVVTFIGGMSLYTAMACWTQQCQGMFTTNPITIGLSAVPGGFGGAIGGFLGGFLIGKFKWLKVPIVLTVANIMKFIADCVFTTFEPTSFSLALGMGFLAMFGMGMSLVALIVGVQLSCEDKNIGLATLVLGSVRAIGGSVAITIYSAILQNSLAKDVGPRVAEAIVPEGVPLAEVPGVISWLLGGQEDAAQLGLPGATVKIAQEAMKYSWAKAFQHLYYAALSFSAIAIVCSVFIRDETHKMTDHVAVVLENEKTVEKI